MSTGAAIDADGAQRRGVSRRVFLGLLGGTVFAASALAYRTLLDDESFTRLDDDGFGRGPFGSRPFGRSTDGR